MTDGQLIIAGEWVPGAAGRVEEIRSPYDGHVVGQAAIADTSDVDKALAAAEQGAAVWRETPAHARLDILMRAAALVDERVEAIAALLSAENGKTITEARGEVGRASDVIRLAGYEGTQLYGDTLPLDAHRGTGLDKVAFTLRQPCGVVVAITPFKLSLAAGAAQGRTGAGRRQRRRPEAGPGHPTDRAGPGRSVHRRRAAARCAQRSHRLGWPTR